MIYRDYIIRKKNYICDFYKELPIVYVGMYEVGGYDLIYQNVTLYFYKFLKKSFNR